MIIPSIDLMDGKAVQLKQGKEKVLEEEDVFKLVKQFRLYGDIAVIDLDAALGKGDNLELIKKICRMADCRVGGGIRTKERAMELLSAGAKRIIIGTKADPEFLKNFPKDRVMVALDAKGGEVVDKGWTEATGQTPMERLKEIEPYCGSFLFTDVDREGMMQGIRVEEVKKLQEATSNPITMAGGITTLEELKILDELGFDSQIGMALYTGEINLPDALVNNLDWEKGDGLIPTIAQDERGQVLMLAYSTEESLRWTLDVGKATYYSRSRKELWTKGETSGDYQELIRLDHDCDRDTLLFTVRQENVACHTGRYSCFADQKFTPELLYSVLKDRADNPIEGSYTSKILADEDMIKKKISEEAGEVVNYTDRENLVWELADLYYFMNVLMVKKGIEPWEVLNELWRRRK